MKLPIMFLLALGTLSAQAPNPTQNQHTYTPDAGQPIFPSYGSLTHYQSRELSPPHRNESDRFPRARSLCPQHAAKRTSRARWVRPKLKPVSTT